MYTKWIRLQALEKSKERMREKRCAEEIKALMDCMNKIVEKQKKEPPEI